MGKQGRRDERAEACRAILNKLGRGEWGRDKIWYSDESWFDTQGKRFNTRKNQLCAEQRAGNA